MPTSHVEKVLSYWDREAQSFDAIYTGEKPEWKKFLDRVLRRDMYLRFDWVLQNSDDLVDKSVCDLGCGSGRYVVAFVESGARRVLGIDGAYGMVRRATALIQQRRMQDRAEINQTKILDCPTEEMFDIAVAVGVFDYTQDAVPLLQKIRKITRSRFLATFPRFWTYRMPIRRIRLGFLGCPVYFYTAQRVRALLGEAHFTCQLIEPIGAIFCVLAFPDTTATRSGGVSTSPAGAS